MLEVTQDAVPFDQVLFANRLSPFSKRPDHTLTKKMIGFTLEETCHLLVLRYVISTGCVPKLVPSASGRVLKRHRAGLPTPQELDACHEAVRQALRRWYRITPRRIMLHHEEN